MKYGLIGETLKHSFSKEIHSLIADYDYKLNEIPKTDIDAFMKSKDFTAINVTIPYKQTVIPYLDEIDPFAKKIGAVNTVVNRDGKLFGFNTDFYGLKSLFSHAKIDVEDKTVAILGSGGTSKTATAVCENLNAKKIVKVSRTKSSDEISYDELYKIAPSIDVLINTTPVGMYPNTDSSPIDLTKFSNLKGVIDVVYNPVRTKLISDALSIGIKAEGGLYMLVAQAVKASEIFLNTTYQDNVLDDVFNKVIKDKENIVLTGMPSSGKSTIGKLLSKKLNKPFIDTDSLIVNKTGKSIPEIFNERGEAHFRKIEKECVYDASLNTGAIIATGGGVVLDKENVSALKRNGKIFFLDRPIERLFPTSDRPTANTEEQIKKRFFERYDIYLSTADHRIQNTGDIEKVVDDILRRV